VEVRFAFQKGVAFTAEIDGLERQPMSSLAHSLNQAGWEKQ